MRHRRQRRNRHTSFRATAGALAVSGLAVATAACGSSSGPSALHGSTTPSGPPATRPTTTTTVPPTTTTEAVQPGWALVSMVGPRIAVDQRTVTGPGGGAVTIVRFHTGAVRFDLHVGSQDPPTGTAAVGPDAGGTIGPDEAPYLLGAFNGGFKTGAGAGGFELAGQVLLPLQPGTASLVIDTDGQAHVGIWGQSLPTPGEAVSSVRQNLPPLVTGGAPSPTAGTTGA